MKLNYQITPAPQAATIPVVLLHGLFGKQDNLGLLKQHLMTQYPVISVDLRNHGLSEWHSEMNYHAMGEDILALLAQLHIPQAHLIGHSMGGKAAMAVAIQQPTQVASLTVADIAPVSYQQDRHSAVFAALQTVAKKPEITSRKDADTLMSQHLAEPSVRQFLLKSFSNDSPSHWQFNLDTLATHYSDIMGWPFSADQQYPEPVLFIKGGASDYLQPEHQPAIMNHFPNATARVIPSCGHWLHAEKPALFNGIVERFLQQVS